MAESCILADRLYVPSQYVVENTLQEFTYYLNEEESYDFGPFQTSTTSVRTYNKVRLNNEVYYAFARGDLAKLGNIFGDIPWEDRTTAPQLTVDLQFKGNLFSWEEKKIGQIEAVTEWLRWKTGVIKAPPRFGKTISSIYILTKMGYKTLIVAHQRDLLNQYIKSLKDFTNVLELQDVKPKQRKRDATGRVYGFFEAYDNPEELDICFLCWQTFNSKYGPERIAKYKKTWGFIIADECHKLGGFCYSRTINRLAARYRLGLTGTVERTDGKEFLLKAIIGPVVARGRVEEVPCAVTIIHTGIPIKFNITEPQAWLYKRIYNAKGRMDVVMHYLTQDINDGRYICFAFHGGSSKQLHEFATKLQLLGIDAEAFDGKCKDRDGVLQRASTGENQVLVCNNRMLTGINIPRWDTYYSAFPNSNIVFNERGELSGNFYQEFSRVRTPFTYENGVVKQFGLIRDFVDDNSFCYGSYRKRYKAYVNQNFSIKIIKIKTKTGVLNSLD